MPCFLQACAAAAKFGIFTVIFAQRSQVFFQPRLLPRRTFDQFDQFFAFRFQALKLAPKLHFFQPAERTQTHVKNGLGLPVIQLELSHHNGLWLIFVTDDFNDAIKVQKRNDITLKQFKAAIDLFQPVLRFAHQHFDLVCQPTQQNLAQAHNLGRPVGIEHVHVQRKTCFKVREAEQSVFQIFGIDITAFGYKHDTNAFVAFVADVIQYGQLLIGNQLRDLLNQLAFLHLIRNFRHNKLPRAAGQFFNACGFPAFLAVLPSV